MIRKHQGKNAQVMMGRRQLQRWEPLRPLPHIKRALKKNTQPASARDSINAHSILPLPLTDLALALEGDIQPSLIRHRTNDLGIATATLLPLTELALGSETQSGPAPYNKNDPATAPVTPSQSTKPVLHRSEHDPASECDSLSSSYPSPQPPSSPLRSTPSSCSFPSVSSSFLPSSGSLSPSCEGPAVKYQPHLNPVTPPDPLSTNIHTKTPTPPTTSSMDVNTNTARQKTPPPANMDSTTPTQQSSLYEVRSTANKGQGMFATKNIPAGTLLIEEAPLLSVPSGSGMAQLVIRSFANMPLADKKAWMTLSARDTAQKIVDEAEESEEDTDGKASAADSISSVLSLADDEGVKRRQDALRKLCDKLSRSQNVENATLEQMQENWVNKLAALLIGEDDETEHCTDGKKSPRPVYHAQDFKPLYEEGAARMREGERERETLRFAESLCNERDCARPKRSAHVRNDSVMGHVVPDDVGREDIVRENSTGGDIPGEDTISEDTPSEDLVDKNTPCQSLPNRVITREDTIENNIPEARPTQIKPAQPTFFNTEKALNIFETNALGCEVGDDIVAALCLNAARMNHSCTPNAFCAYNAESKTHTVHAIKRIAAGEEICNSYIAGTCLTSRDRKAELEKWGFECTCPACGGEIKGSDERRSQLYSLRQKADTARERFQQGQLSPEAAVEGAAVIVQMVELMDKEGLVGGEMVDL